MKFLLALVSCLVNDACLDRRISGSKGVLKLCRGPVLSSYEFYVNLPGRTRGTMRARGNHCHDFKIVPIKNEIAHQIRTTMSGPIRASAIRFHCG